MMYTVHCRILYGLGYSPPGARVKVRSGETHGCSCSATSSLRLSRGWRAELLSAPPVLVSATACCTGMIRKKVHSTRWAAKGDQLMML